VVWWDPHRLRLGAEADFGLQQAQMLKDDGGASMRAYQTWRDQRSVLIVTGSRPSFDVFLPSQTSEPAPAAIPIEFISIPVTSRPGGRRFGTLVHAALRDVDLTGSRQAIEQTVSLHARVLGATGEEVAAAQSAIEAALAHPLLAQAQASKRCHREYPVTLDLGDSRVMEGVIDLAFVENDSWVVVDFKTDASLEDTRIRYERQLQWYAHALAIVTGLPARAVLLSV
jgi:ATP-dependent exoDNAse (exonuclease V) beta subunit